MEVPPGQDVAELSGKASLSMTKLWQGHEQESTLDLGAIGTRFEYGETG